MAKRKDEKRKDEEGLIGKAKEKAADALGVGDGQDAPKTKARAKERPQETADPKLGRLGLDTARLKRARPRKDEEEEEYRQDGGPASVSAGPIEKIAELAFNPSREKIREVTIIDRMQGRLFPIMDAMNALYNNCIEIATFRQSREDYKAWYRRPKPEPLDIMDELMFRTAQWQKSVAGKNLERATDITLAEMETRSSEDEDAFDRGGGRGFDD